MCFFVGTPTCNKPVYYRLPPRLHDLHLGCLVPSTKRLKCQRDESDPLPLAIVSSSPHFSVKSEVKAVTWCCSCLHHGRLLQWVDDRTSRAASLPSAQFGRKISAGLLSFPGKMKRPSFTGFSTAAAAIWCT